MTLVAIGGFDTRNQQHAFARCTDYSTSECINTVSIAAGKLVDRADRARPEVLAERFHEAEATTRMPGTAHPQAYHASLSLTE